MPITRSNTLHFNRHKSSGFDFTFIDGQIRQKLYVAGTDLNIFVYDGVYDQQRDITSASNTSQRFTSSPSTQGYRSVKQAFDDDPATHYEGVTPPSLAGNEFIQIDLGSDDSNRAIVNGLGIAGFGVQTLPTALEFYGSADDITWDILAVLTTTTSDDLQTFDVLNDVGYRYYKLVAANDAHDLGVWKISAIELYSEPGATGVQDHFFIENRDRKYSSTPLQLMCWYDIPDKPHDLGMFGFGIPSDQVELTILMSDVQTLLGRALMTGDIVTLPHLGDHSTDDANTQYGAVSDNEFGKMYEVIDVNIPSDGYDRMWRSHLHTVVATPLKARQETYDVTGVPDEGFIDLDAPHPLTTHESNTALNNEVQREAQNSGELGIDTSNLSGNSSNPCTQDGIPNDGSPYTVGTDFPSAPALDEWFLNESYSVPRLYQYNGTKWVQREKAIRSTLGAHDTERGVLRRMLDGNSQPVTKK